MKIIEAISGLGEIGGVRQGCVLTIGNFDGVHLGHREILNAARQTAVERGAELVVMTFEPHPVAILHPEKAPAVLTPLDSKKYLLAEFETDCLIVLRDNAELLSLSAKDFVDRFLVKNIRPSVVIEGEDFNFGVGRAGSVGTLQKLGADRGFEVSVVGAKKVKLSTGQTVRVSSTIIRYMLEAGHVADAAVALGRPYRLVEKTIGGRGKGKKLGFPTLNMEPPKQIIPAEGVYAGFVETADSFEQLCFAKKKEAAVFSIGQASTYGEDIPLLVEAHLLAEDVGDLVGKWMAMDFVEHIRSQHKFKTEKQLAEQIAKDCETARKILT